MFVSCGEHILYLVIADAAKSSKDAAVLLGMCKTCSHSFQLAQEDGVFWGNMWT